MASYDPFPNSEFMMQFKNHVLEEGNYPPPEDCIMDMVKAQLQVWSGQHDNNIFILYSAKSIQFKALHN